MTIRNLLCGALAAALATIIGLPALAQPDWRQRSELPHGGSEFELYLCGLVESSRAGWVAAANCFTLPR